MSKNKCGIGCIYFVMIIGIIALFLINVCFGSINISLDELKKIVTNNHANDLYKDIIIQIRLPRTIASLFLGGALALSGYLLQTFFHNPIAGPYVLGISSGAKLVVALMMVLCLKQSIHFSSLAMICAAFAGSMLSMFFVLLMSKTLKNMSMLIISGVMIGYICSAITDFVVTFAEDSNIVNLHNWSLGSFSGTTWSNVKVITIVCLICFAAVFMMSKPMLAFQLGENYAKNMGVNTSLFKVLLVILSSILSATVTAFAGPISFVGIAVPQLVKGIFKTSKPIIIIPATVLGGGIFCLGCDFMARMLFSPTELSISTITAFFGAPIVIYVMIKKKGLKNE